MTTDHEASRTLVKSPPELWAECSDAGALARHLDGSFGEIRITRLEAESVVAWEGERVSGTVRIEPSGWGTRVTLTAQTPGQEPVAEAEEEPPAVEAVEAVEESKWPESVAPQPVTWWGKLRLRLMGSAASEAEVEPEVVVMEPEVVEPQPPVVEPVEEPVAAEPPGPDAKAVLTAALDSLGQAHHRPFSRA